MTYSAKFTNGVLIVEDDPDSAFLLEHRLKKLDIPVLEIITTGEMAVSQVDDLSPDLVLMDIQLQGDMDGIEAAKKITQQFDVPIIFLTAHSDRQTLDRAAASGHYGYILKPVDSRQLDVSIQVALKQHRLEQELVISRAWFQETIYGIADMVITTDTDGIIDYVNPAGLEMLQRNRKDVVGRKLSELIAIKDKHSVDISGQILHGAADAALYRRDEHYIRVNRSPEIPVDLTVIPIITRRKLVGWVLFFHDITQRKQYEQDLVRARDDLNAYKTELQHLSDHLRSIQEKERGNISREIHDEIAQNLARIRMDIQNVKKKCEEEELQTLNNASELVDETIQSVRRIATELRPRILDDVGLIAAVQWQVNQIKARDELDIELSYEPEEFSIDHEMAVDIFRIVQESLHNIIKHANASTASIKLFQNAQEVVVLIADDGVGFEQDALQSTSSLGIVGMRERARRWNGKFSVTSSPGKGTQVEVTIADTSINFE